MQHDQPHVLYRMFDADDRLLYVGITMDVEDRFHAHRHSKSWWPSVATIKLEHYPDRLSVLDAELAAIRTEQPAHNLYGNYPIKTEYDPDLGFEYDFSLPADESNWGNMVQMNVRMDELTRKKAIAIARIRKERDGFGFGLSVVFRRVVTQYVTQHDHLLDDV